MQLLIFASVLAVIIAAQSCSTNKKVALSEKMGGVSVAAFDQHVTPVTKSHCASCHGTAQNPLFATNAPKWDHHILLDYNLVSLTNPSDSEVVKKISAGHEGVDPAVAKELETGIWAWAKQLNFPQERNTHEINLAVQKAEAPRVGDLILNRNAFSDIPQQRTVTVMSPAATAPQTLHNDYPKYTLRKPAVRTQPPTKFARKRKRR